MSPAMGNFVPKWESNNPIDFSAYSGQVISVTVRGQNGGGTYINNVNAMSLLFN